jgi:predicted kinase
VESVLLILSGLPGVGKTAIARAAAGRLRAVHLRIDSIEQCVRDYLPGQDLEELGYRVAYAVAEDNLRLGHIVIADCVNPIALTRNAWLGVARRAGVDAVEIEVRCSDVSEHRRRVETRGGDIPGLKAPSWSDILAREYRAWDRDHVVIDTARQSIEQSVEIVRGLVERRDVRAR